MLTPGWEESLLLNPKRTNKEKNYYITRSYVEKTKGLFGFSLGLLGTESWLTCDETIEDVGA